MQHGDSLDVHVRADGEMEIVVWMNEIGERVASFPDFLDLVLEMIGADIAERQRTHRSSRPRAQLLPALRRPAGAAA